MEEPGNGIKFGRVSFLRHCSLSRSMNERMEKTREQKAVEFSRQKSQHSSFYHPLEFPRSPHRAMEFLSRTWSPSSSDFIQILSSNSRVPCLEEHDEDLEELETEKNKIHLNGSNSSVDQIWTVLSSGKLAPTSPRKHSIYRKWTWLGGEVFSSLLRGKKIKEGLRLQAAQVHAALSATKLAAGIAGIVASCSFHPSNSKNLSMDSQGGECSKKMNTVVASAVALVMVVLAEAAESLGVNRAHIESVISKGLAAQTPADMLTLTATAATCLREASTLKSRAEACRNSPVDQKILAGGSELLIRMPSGRVQLRMVYICLKHNELTLRLGKKHLHGFFRRFKKYRIFDAMEAMKDGAFTKDDNGFYLITLDTTGGTMQVLFQEKNQYAVWKSTISHLLSDHKKLKAFF